MQQTYSLQEKISQFWIILFPIFISQIGLFSMNIVDTMMSGHVGPGELAGVAIGSSLWLPIFAGLNGIFIAMTPIVAQQLGAGEQKKIAFYVRQGLYVAVVIALFVYFIGFFLLDIILNGMSIEEHVRYVAKHYLIGLTTGIIPLFMFQILRSTIDALGHTRVTMFITLIALPVNVLLNYLLIFGKLGFPRLGGIGAGYATALTYLFIVLVTGFLLRRLPALNEYQILQGRFPVDLAVWKELLKVGMPIGLALFFETSIFAAVTLLMSSYDTITIASHQGAMTFESFLYMVPLSISMALTIVVGYEAGAKRYQDAKVYIQIGITLAVLFGLLLAVFIYLFRANVAGFFTKDHDTLLLTQHFLIYAIFFQLSDAVAAPLQGALRGFKDVNWIFIMAMISYWIIGLPLGFILSNYTSLGPFGYWVGLITGLAAGAVTLSGRMFYLLRQLQHHA
ncbi:MATE family efflux transporter [Rubeoparvulum massiliense]|uniref:MATE family efflux transporter n=1 Tax=Rubeoparvulum massiliense TaxID=1631346 RepID=UPI00065E1F2D|nr:MATE family efflux transporter [Rubeoparvulum massiliense]